MRALSRILDEEVVKMALFEVKPLDRKIYEEELRDFLPDKMIDIHTHIWTRELRPVEPLKPGEVRRTVAWPDLVADPARK